MAKWQSMVINGPCWYMQTKNSTLKNLGTGSSEASFLSGSVCSNLHLLLFTPSPAGLQAYFYLTQLSGERGQGNEIRQRSYTWHDSGHPGVFSLCSYTGVYAINFLSLESEHPASFAFHCHRLQCSAGLIPPRTRNDSMRVSWIS